MLFRVEWVNLILDEIIFLDNISSVFEKHYHSENFSKEADKL